MSELTDFFPLRVGRQAVPAPIYRAAWLPCIRTATKRLCRKDPKLLGGSLLVIFPTSPKRVITLLSLLLLSLSQRDRENAFKFGISLSRDSAMRNPKLNGCRHSLPPHA